MVKDEHIPDDLRFQRYAHDTNIQGHLPEGQAGRIRKRNMHLSPDAFHAQTTDKTVRWALGEKVRALAHLLRPLT